MKRFLIPLLVAACGSSLAQDLPADAAPPEAQVLRMPCDNARNETGAARTADRFRVPLVTPPAEGDPKAVDALGERERLLAVPQPACGTAAFLPPRSPRGSPTGRTH